MWDWLRATPGTYLWLVLLLATTLALRRMPQQRRDRVLRSQSTNLHNLMRGQLWVLVTSGLVIDGAWWLYLVLYNAFHMPAERWLGTGRWLAVVAVAHVGATLISQGVLYAEIRRGSSLRADLRVMDYGVSYALAGVAAVLTYRIADPWRFVYALGVLTFYAVGLARARDFTAVGHMSAALLGFACYPLT